MQHKHNVKVGICITTTRYSSVSIATLATSGARHINVCVKQNILFLTIPLIRQMT